jgi:hypothetical protein
MVPYGRLEGPIAFITGTESPSPGGGDVML